MSDEALSVIDSGESEALLALRAKRNTIAAKRAEIAAKREDSAREATERDLLEREVVALEDEQALLELEQKYGPREHGKIAFSDLGFTVVLCRPDNAVFKVFQDKAASSKGVNHDATNEYVMRCVIHPTKARYASLAATYPGIVTPLATLAHRLAGFRAEDLEAK